MPQGKFFYIRSCLNDMVLDIENCDDSPGAKLVLWEKKDDEPDNQLWYEERATRTIRSKLNDLCITYKDDGLEMEEYDEDNEDQTWAIKPGQGVVRNIGDRDQVFDVLDANTDEGARVGAWEQNGNDNQKFEFDRVNVRYFMIKSELNGLVLDIEAQSSDEGAKVIMWDETGEDNQLWYEDEDGILRSKLNDFAISCDEGEDAEMRECDRDCEHHQWHRVGPFIGMRVRRGHLVLDIKDCNEDPGAEITAWERNGNDNQRWRYEYH